MRIFLRRAWQALPIDLFEPGMHMLVEKEEEGS
jgi:hypothetical protein